MILIVLLVCHFRRNRHGNDEVVRWYAVNLHPNPWRRNRRCDWRRRGGKRQTPGTGIRDDRRDDSDDHRIPCLGTDMGGHRPPDPQSPEQLVSCVTPRRQSIHPKMERLTTGV